MSKKISGFKPRFYKQDFATEELTKLAVTEGITLSDNVAAPKDYLGQKIWIMEGLKEENDDLKVYFLVLYMDTMRIIVSGNEDYKVKSTPLKDDITVKTKEALIQLSKRINADNLISYVQI